MKFDLSKIECSKYDLTRKIRLPRRLNEELAEFIGIMLGDGHLRFSRVIDKRGYKITKSDIIISGNKKEKEYHDYITKLFNLIFNLNLYYKQDTAPNAILLLAHSKGIVQYLNLICEVPLNRKAEIIKIPWIIKNADKSIKAAFLRGLADTDFTLTFKNRCGKGHNYPVIKGAFKSRQLIEDLERLYPTFGFKYCVVYNERGFDKRRNVYDVRNCIYLNGRKNFEKWLRDVRFSNPKFHRKIQKWQTDRDCPPGY